MFIFILFFPLFGKTHTSQYTLLTIRLSLSDKTTWVNETIHYQMVPLNYSFDININILPFLT